MDLYRVEILGKVPNGLTHNEVFATVNSLVRLKAFTQSVNKRRLAGNMVSIIAVFAADSSAEAGQIARYAGTSVTGFSFDTIVRKVKN